MSATKQVLDTNDRASEILFGLIMVLTFTGTLSIAEAGRDDVREMLIGALGCNVAWGIIDGIFYLMACLAERSSNLKALHAARTSADPKRAREIVAESLPPMVAQVLSADELQSIQQRLVKLPEPPARAGLTKDDWWGALGVFLLVFISTFPVAIPFMFMDQIGEAMRVSNAIAITMLFFTGYAYGRMTAYRPWLVGAFMVLFGVLLVGMTIALGG